MKLSPHWPTPEGSLRARSSSTGGPRNRRAPGFASKRRGWPVTGRYFLRLICLLFITPVGVPFSHLRFWARPASSPGAAASVECQGRRSPVSAGRLDSTEGPRRCRDCVPAAPLIRADRRVRPR
ncbi:hypothetical protein NDU88_002589 [Pleurodeles waltl]|uniref:Uncharacterized protein n=1 Tax=Pleurodeles waltl TaxID=8319 RepID=A0AAV7WP01_PLEWA|nr:hypothetical protein NDU88_002589 [Pleurodeles waltl]